MLISIDKIYCMRKKLILIIIICHCSFCIAQDNDKHLVYLNEESSETNVNADKFYYVTSKSDSVFFKDIKRSLITFVKGNKSVSIDELNGSDSNGTIQLNNSCGIKDLSLEMINNNLNDIKGYKGIDIKRVKDQKPFNINRNEITGIMLYSKKLRYLVEPYLKKLNELKEKYGVDYILITLDTTLINSLPDSYENMGIGM